MPTLVSKESCKMVVSLVPECQLSQQLEDECVRQQS